MPLDIYFLGIFHPGTHHSAIIKSATFKHLRSVVKGWRTDLTLIGVQLACLPAPAKKSGVETVDNKELPTTTCGLRISSSHQEVIEVWMHSLAARNVLLLRVVDDVIASLCWPRAG